MRSADIDAIDWKILAELQADASLTNVELARRVGISPPPCLRRVRVLEEAGYIRGYRALLDGAALGYPVVCFAFVQLISQAEGDLTAFAARVGAWRTVRECWTLSGDIDFLLKCVTADLSALQGFVQELTATANVRTVRTALALGQVKDEPIAPLAGTEHLAG